MYRCRYELVAQISRQRTPSLRAWEGRRSQSPRMLMTTVTKMMVYENIDLLTTGLPCNAPFREIPPFVASGARGAEVRLPSAGVETVPSPRSL